MEENDGMTSGSASGATSKKSSKKSSKHHHGHHNLTPSKGKARGHHHVSLPPSIAERPKSPLLVHANNLKHSGRASERYSGLWECYYDRERVEDVIGEGGEGVRGEDPVNRLKNIRGFILKRRKSPLKGWHKRYFMLEQGTLYFSRNQAQMLKGKVLGSIDLGLSFIHTDAASRRIDIDGEHQVLHLKTKNPGHFTAWSSCLLSHEMFRKTQLAAGTAPEGHTHLRKGGVVPSVLVGDGESLDLWAERTHTTITGVRKDLDVIRENLEAMSVYVRSPAPTNQSAYSSNTGTANFPHTSSATELKQLENGSDSQSTTSSATSSDAPRGATTTEGAKGEGGKGDGGGGGKIKKKFRKGKQDKKSKDSSSHLSPEQIAPFGSTSQLLVDEGVSTTATIDSGANRDDFTATAKIIYAQFCELIDKLDKVGSGLNQVVQQTNSTLRQQENIISNQQLLLRQSLLQSNELRDRLSQIQQLASGLDTPVSLRGGTPGVAPPTRHTPSQSYHHGASIPRFDSYMSLQSSLSEKFFDALDDLRERSSESEEEEEEEEEVLNTEEEEEESQEEESDSELFTSLTHDVLSAIQLPPTPKQSVPSVYTLSKAPSEDVRQEVEVRQRRTKLPCPIQDMGDFSLWSILRKNIGKDLSKISMPVTLNEPLSALQRLCEELEYSELLDEAASHDNIYDRMVKVAAFAVSSFALNFHRAGRKPFNPILGETYECVREDKGFKFIAEQVSHHPPIAACHCTSPNFNFWQDARIKSKFWGKSMEVFPIGITNVTLPKHGDHYRWQKVTSCIHNLLGGQRWVDLYGEMIINNLDKCTCKLTFIKASYWSSKKYIVHGDVYDSDGVKVRHLFGTWHEALFCGEDPDSAQCVWRTAPMPEDYDKYFSFGQFAIELNELEEGLKDLLPRTDCRFRPDQRLLEEGFVQEAGVEKHRVEQIQREARAERERLGLEWRPNFFELSEDEGGDECWVAKGNYWKYRESGFKDIQLPRLW